MKYQINSFTISTEVNGPGKRFVIWFQGCSLRCPGCINRKLWDFNGGKSYELEEILSEIHKVRSEIEGVTFTGGEPLDQGKKIIYLSREIKKLSLTLFVFSGYTFEEIAGKFDWGREFLNYVDILVAGRFIEKLSAPLKWRGSSNQKIYFLSNRYRHLEKSINERIYEFEIHLDQSMKGLITGFPDGKILDELLKEE